MANTLFNDFESYVDSMEFKEFMVQELKSNKQRTIDSLLIRLTCEYRPAENCGLLKLTINEHSTPMVAFVKRFDAQYLSDVLNNKNFTKLTNSLEIFLHSQRWPYRNYMHELEEVTQEMQEKINNSEPNVEVKGANFTYDIQVYNIPNHAFMYM